MRKQGTNLVFGLCALFAANAATAGVWTAPEHHGWILEGGLGTAYNIPSDVTIRQEGQPHIKVHGEFDTRPFGPPPYYNFRAGYWKGDAAWEFEFIHHKIFMRNMPPEIQNFSISNGFNIVTINRAWQHKYFHHRFGLGLILSHPENIIRGQLFSEDGGWFDNGFYFSGPVAQLGLGKRFYMKSFFVSVEGKFSAAYYKVPIVDGDGYGFNFALHGLVGIGYDFGKE